MPKMKIKYLNALLVYLLCIIVRSFETDTKSICSQCPSPSTRSYMTQFCKKENSTGSLQQTGSCCMNTTLPAQQVIGVDMSGCSLTKISEVFSNMQQLSVIMLENNTDLRIEQEDFNGLSRLLYLSLPDNLHCPGGNASWNSIEILNTSVICHGEINLCVQNNVTCQNNNSECTLTGPGQMDCLCLLGYHGYKCLRQGTFPTVSYSIVLCVCTVVISVIMWCTQRRKVGRKTHSQ